MFENFVAPDKSDIIDKRKGPYLPHWTLENGTYHVRFSLADSLPEQVRHDLLSERELILAKTKKVDGSLTKFEKRRLILLYMDKVEQSLDTGLGECWLKRPQIGVLIANALKFFEVQRYCLYAWSVMPNHVHAIVQPGKGFELSQILHSWKSYTAKEANKILGRNGEFWQSEYFDHLIRNEDDLVRKIEYVWKNPDKAGLKDWKWRWKIPYAGSV